MGFTVGFWGEGCDIKKDHDIVGNGYVEDGFYRLSVVDEHPSAADYDPMIDNEVNLDNDDHADDEANDSGFNMTCGGRKCVIKAGDMVVFKMYNDGVLYKMNLSEEPPLATVVHHETIGLLIANEHPKLTEARARGWTCCKLLLLLWKKIDIRWQEKIECFNCQKLGHFARECKFAKYQANRANGRMKLIFAPVALALMATSSTDSSNSDGQSRRGTKRSCYYCNVVALKYDLDKDKLYISRITKEVMSLLICDKKPYCFFYATEVYNFITEFKIVDENLVLLRAPRKNDVYSLNLKNIIPSGGVTCLVAKASEDEAILWHRRLGHVNFKNINKLVKSNLVREAEDERGRETVENTLRVAHMDLFGHVYKVENMAYSCLIMGLENKLRRKVKTIRVLVTKPQMKTPYELLMGKPPNISFMKPFGCSLTILNTMDHLGKFEGKSEEGYLLGYSTNSKGFRVYNRVTRKVQDCLHVDFLEDQMNQNGKVDKAVNRSNSDDFEDIDDQQFIVHGSSSIGNKAVSGAITNDAQN
ncbi:ribonuclease H-like domain-containing protein [Tanacetum coccineum]